LSMFASQARLLTTFLKSFPTTLPLKALSRQP
jgi:hypothetical protein